MKVFELETLTEFNGEEGKPIYIAHEGKVFDVWETEGGITFILSYGEGKIKLPGIHDIELDVTYRITYQSRQRNLASVIISIEKLDG